MAQFKHISLHFVTAMRFFHNYCLQRASDAAKFHTPPTETSNCRRHSAPISRGQTPLHWGNKPVGSGNNLHVTPRKVLCLGEQSIFKSFVRIFRSFVYINKSFEYSYKSFVFTLLTEARNFSRRGVELHAPGRAVFPPPMPPWGQETHRRMPHVDGPAPPPARTGMRHIGRWMAGRGRKKRGQPPLAAPAEMGLPPADYSALSV